MFALIEAKGFQYKVKSGDKIIVPFLDKKEGEEVEFPVLLLQDENDDVKIGTPYVEGVTAKAKVLRNLKGPKVLVFKFKRRKRYRVLKGHRQMYTEVELQKIDTGR